METGKAGGTKPTVLGTAWATGSWGGIESVGHSFIRESFGQILSVLLVPAQAS